MYSKYTITTIYTHYFSNDSTNYTKQNRRRRRRRQSVEQRVKTMTMSYIYTRYSHPLTLSLTPSLLHSHVIFSAILHSPFSPTMKTKQQLLFLPHTLFLSFSLSFSASGINRAQVNINIYREERERERGFLEALNTKFPYKAYIL